MLTKLGKLLRYEFRFYFRIMPPLYGALFILALILAIGGDVPQSSAFWGIAVFWSVVAIAAFIVNIILIIQRFIDNLLKTPGYLMFTLPVSAGTLTASKVIAAFSVFILTILVCGVSGLIYFSIGNDVLTYGWRKLLDYLADQGNLTNLVLSCVTGIILIIQQICLIYLLLTAAQILPRFRAFAAFAGYIAVMGFVEQPLIQLVLGSLNVPESSVIIPFGLVNLAFGVLYFWLTGFLLKRTLNLE
jgi:hypothetical protein